MPWNATTIAKKNKALHGEKAGHAARIANAVLRNGSHSHGISQEGLALAVANRWAQHHRRAAGGPVADTNAYGRSETQIQNDIMAGLSGLRGATQGAALQQFIASQPQPTTAGGNWNGFMQGQGAGPPQGAPIGRGYTPPPQQPSYLAGTAGSPVNLSALPTYTPSVPSSTGINSAGLMSVPQTGSYYLDPNTGALSGATQTALQQLAQRGLQIGAPPASAAPAAGAAQPGITGQGGSGPEGAGNAGNAGGANTSAVGNNMTMDIIGGQGPSLGFSGAGAKAGALAGGIAGGLPGAIAGGLAGGIGAGSSMGTSQDPGAQPTAGDLGIGALGAGIDSGADMGDITGGAGLDGGNAHGGRIKKRAMGGAMSMSPSSESPWWTRSEARAGEHPSGLVNSPIGGRSDHIPMSLAAGSYVVPADVISGMGQGNTLSGAHAFDQMIHSGPFGTKLPMPRLRGTLPKPPSMPRTVHASHFSRGGRTRGRVPVIVAGGERIVSPEEVAALSGGDIKRGHDLLDKWVVETRKHVIKHTKALPGPAK